MLKMMLALALTASAAVAAGATDAAADRAPPTQMPSTMTPTEIKAFNEGLAPTHPYYIKCRKTLEIGSLVKKNRVCHTNEQWKSVWAKENQDARDTTEAMTRAPVNHSN
ncbi:hypothetical protein [Sphingopyxis sp. PET50]|uniref:hypothetical protein n=1 Tax=Sphingopyxis sp. PET50 TaxID=2976533 RepID=UPI0021B06978|nr:hypothetical protein [Sphingopyxis sp. PET50]